MKIFSPEEINKWLISKDDSNKCDQYGTAVCPYCGIDSVIGESSGYPYYFDELQVPALMHY